MHVIKTTLLTIALAMTAITPTAAQGQESQAPTRRVTGNIVEIDRSSRTLRIQDHRTGEVIAARVPAGQLVTLLENANPGSMPRSIPFELAMRGLVVDLLVTTVIP